ncbi:non-ribosomal peptide synthetase [Kitasatospora purpeofusca]|uniref:non-ribosomal peptide synthetase n=1 Tax=Kitasatospora purpeofusca TaxID=67352 RepID=UPI00225088CC|nr:non-ribosomal peptide synthetase [Kitasatospora purpeofusca]MCX4756314.1 non-ribosomal peptide synthetase [Kitasatospora purpeofusca]WSR35859.1 non-ribosomal peptide synthetase [Kitasatospora purpeofusca]
MHSSITAAYLTRYRSLASAAGTGPDPAPLLPLTGAQRRFLITRHRDRLARTDIVPLFFAFPRGTVDLPRLRRAALRLAHQHPALCGEFTVLRGTPVLRLGEPSVEVVRVPVDPSGPGAGTADEAAGAALPDGPARAALLRALLDWPTDGPALRLLLAAGPQDEEELLAVALDHAACDEQSLGLVTEGLGAAYADPDGGEHAPGAGQAEAVDTYRAAVEGQLDAEARAASEAAQRHWAARLGALADAPEGTGPDGAARSTGMAVDRLPAVTGAARSGVFPALLDAVAAAAHRLDGGDRVLALGYPWGGRPADTAPVLGCFLNTLVHPAPPGPPRPLDALGAEWWDDLDHADTPYDEVVRAARSAGASWSGALDGLLTFEDLHRRPPLVLGGTAGREVHLAGRPLAAPIAVSASHGEDLLVRLAWDRERYSDTAAEAAFAALLATLRHHLGAGA